MRKSISITLLRDGFFLAFFTIPNLYLFFHFPLGQAIHIALLSISCYILCTPLFGGGVLIKAASCYLLRGPFYLLEMIAWCASIILNSISYYYTPLIYTKAGAPHLLYRIISTPRPYWLIIGVSFLPVLVSWIHHRYGIIKRKPLYFLLQYGLAVLGLFVLHTIAYRDFVFTFNIHA